MNRLSYIYKKTVIWCVVGMLLIGGMGFTGMRFSQEAARRRAISADIKSRQFELDTLEAEMIPKKNLLAAWRKESVSGLPNITQWVDSRKESGDFDITAVNGDLASGKANLQLSTRSAVLAEFLQNMNTNHPAILVDRLAIRRESSLKVDLDLRTVDSKNKELK